MCPRNNLSELIIEGCYPDHDILQSPASDTPPGMRLTTDSSWNEKVLAQDYPHDGASQDRVSRALKSAAFLLEVPI